MTENFYEEEEFQSKISGNTIKRIFQFAIPHRRWFILFLIFTLITTLMDSTQVYLNKLLIDNAVIPGDKAEAIRL